MTSWLASVTTNGNMSNFATRMPFISPSSEQMQTAATQAKKLLCVASSTTPIVVLANARREPTDRSMPPAVITKTIPSAKMPFRETEFMIFVILPSFRKLSLVRDNMANRHSIIKNMPYRFINSRMLYSRLSDMRRSLKFFIGTPHFSCRILCSGYPPG